MQFVMYMQIVSLKLHVYHRYFTGGFLLRHISNCRHSPALIVAHNLPITDVQLFRAVHNTQSAFYRAATDAVEVLVPRAG